MYLKSMELHGFKSFPDKTVLNFERGVTVVVGPNGSGKSNISDAMRWVLGEISSKNIRGSRMEDVIFGGANSRAPMGFAEVSVTFDNSPENGKIDYPDEEITVTRRYFRAGESEYYINRKAVRLKDIHELFMSTGIGREGYSIIGQGKIAEILSRKSEDRRNIFEEAAGISKYRYKKQEAERRLSAAQDNIVRINDIFGELEARIGPLERDAEKARKYLDYYEQKKKADVSLWLYDTESLRVALAEAEDNFRLAKSELDIASEQSERLEDEYEKTNENAQKNRMRFEHLLNEIKSKNELISSLESDFKISQNNILHFEEKISELDASSAAKDQQITAMREEENAANEKIASLEAKLSETETARFDTAVEQTRLTELAAEKNVLLEKKLAEYKELDAERNELRVRLSVIENAMTSGSEKDSDISSEMAKYREVSAGLKEDMERTGKTVSEYKEKLAENDEKLSSLQKKIDAENAKLSELSEKKNDILVNVRSLDQRIEALKRMEEHFEGYAAGVRFVMQEYDKGNIKGEIYGPLSKLITVDDKYITAIETALGASVQNIVVKDEFTAKNSIYALRNASAGRATFYPLTSMKASERTKDMLRAPSFGGFIGFADELISFDAKYKNVVSSQLGRTVIFDNIENATTMAKAVNYTVRIVTLDGQQINAGGSFTGGSQKRDSGMLSRSKDIDRLTERKNSLAGELDLVIKNIANAETALQDAKKEYSGVYENKAILEMMLRNEMSSLNVYEAKLSANENLLLGIEEDHRRLSQQSEQYEKDTEQLTFEIADIEAKQFAISEERDELELSKNELLDTAAELGAKISECMISEAETRKEIEVSKESLEALGARIAFAQSELMAYSEQKSAIRTNIEELQRSRGENRREAEESERLLDSLTKEKLQVDEDSLKLEKRLTELRATIKDKNNQKELLFRSYTKSENKLTQLKNDTDKMVAKLWDDYELTHSTAAELGYPPVTAETRASVAALQTEYKNKLKNLGNVNVGAIEEYADVKARYDTMSLQLKDLEQTGKDLSKIIYDLEAEMRVKFIETFNTVNTNFNEVFRELFGGGSAEVVLTDPDDVLNSGIEIKAAPPGKIIKNLSLLSGGEQSFVAIALFFAVLKHSPTPFSILDEIEAALDEVNVDRFAEYVRKYSLDTQFILITHRRGTMDVADRLYGVTMPQKGISKVLTINVSEIEKFKKDMLA